MMINPACQLSSLIFLTLSPNAEHRNGVRKLIEVFEVGCFGHRPDDVVHDGCLMDTRNWRLNCSV